MNAVGGRSDSARNGPGTTESYLICATPRTGSTLLCGLLESTGVAGHPDSYFRRADRRSWATRWNVTGAADDRIEIADFVHAALSAGQTDNGVFAARVMWGTLEEVIDELATVYPDMAGTGAGLLDRAFGRTRFVHLSRDDLVGQAVSWLRAEQTDQWQESDQRWAVAPGHGPRFDANRLDDLVDTIGRHNRAWREWFARAGISPYRLRYEDLVHDPVGATGGLLDFLGLELPPGVEIRVRHRKLGDELNAGWSDRYRALRGR